MVRRSVNVNWNSCAAIAMVLSAIHLISCSGAVGGFEGSSRKEGSKTPEEEEKETSEPAEVAGAFLTCLTGVPDSIVKQGETGVGCTVMSGEGQKLSSTGLIFKGQILDSNRSPISVESRAPSASEDYHFVASVPSDLMATGYAGMRIEKMGSTTKHDLEPILLSKATSFSSCAPNCNTAAAPVNREPGVAMYGVSAVGSAAKWSSQFQGVLSLISCTTPRQSADRFKASFEISAAAVDGFRPMAISGVPDWQTSAKSCSLIETNGKRFADCDNNVVFFNIALKNQIDDKTGRPRILVVAVDSKNVPFAQLNSMTGPSSDPVCQAMLTEKAGTNANNGLGGLLP